MRRVKKQETHLDHEKLLVLCSKLPPNIAKRISAVEQYNSTTRYVIFYAPDFDADDGNTFFDDDKTIHWTETKTFPSEELLAYICLVVS